MSTNSVILKVLSLIAQKGPISRPQIGRTLGLQPSAVTPIVNALLEKELVQEIGFDAATIGRKPALLELYAGSHVLAGVKIQFSFVQILFMD